MGSRSLARRIRLCVTSTVSALALLAATSFPAPARASVFDDIGSLLTEVTGLRGVVKSLGQGASEGARQEIEKLLADVDPLLTRADAILAARIDQVSGATLEALRHAQAALRDVLDHAKDLTVAVIREARESLAGLLKDVDALLEKVLCKIAPEGNGLLVRIPVLGGPDDITVWRPLRTHCYRDFLASQSNPLWATFVGWEYYDGEICEARLALAEIDPRDPRSIARMSAAYAQLAAMSTRAVCAQPTPERRRRLLEMEIRFEQDAAFFEKLASPAPSTAP